MKIFSKPYAALLAASLIIATAPSIVANNPAIQETFSRIDNVYIGLVTTIPALFIILGILCSSLLELRIGRKYTIVTGLAIATFFGILPVWLNQNIWIILLSRSIFGFGIGLFNRLIIQSINRLFKDNPVQRAQALGLESACEGLGGIGMTLMVGQLIKISWQSTFIVYATGLIGLILILLFLPNEKGELKSVVQENSSKASSDIAFYKIIGMSFIFLFVVIAFMVYSLQITKYILENNIGTATGGSSMIAAISLGAFTSGSLFGTLYSKVGKYLFPLACLIGVCATYFASQAQSILVLFICSFGIGFTLRSIMPYFMNIISTQNEKMVKFGTMMILIAYNIGSTVAPFIVRFNQYMFNTTSANIQLLMGTSIFIVLGIGSFLLNSLPSKTLKITNNS